MSKVSERPTPLALAAARANLAFARFAVVWYEHPRARAGNISDRTRVRWNLQEAEMRLRELEKRA